MAGDGRLYRWFRRSVIVVLLGIGLATAMSAYGWWYYHPEFTREDGVVYGSRGGRDLTMDVLKPTSPNGKAVALMVSGGWRSQKAGEAPAWLVAPLLRSGYTVFAVCHISQPDSTVMEIIEDMNRGIRYIRYHADEYGIDKNRIGVTGGSAGGHLSLMLATRGGPGNLAAEDPVDRESSAVQVVAIFYPVTDLLNLGESTENPGDGGPPKSFVKAFGPDATDMDRWKEMGRECSPIYFVDENLPPTLIYHGDADTLVPLDQSKRFVEKAKENGRQIELVVQPGGGHGWLTMVLDVGNFVKWFDAHLVN